MEDVSFEPNISIDLFQNEIIINGQLINISDYRLIKKTIAKIINEGHKSLSVTFNDTDSITSSVLGYFLKLVQKDKIELKMKVRSNNLYSLLDMLRLVEIFKVSKI